MTLLPFCHKAVQNMSRKTCREQTTAWPASAMELQPCVLTFPLQLPEISRLPALTVANHRAAIRTDTARGAAEVLGSWSLPTPSGTSGLCRIARAFMIYAPLDAVNGDFQDEQLHLTVGGGVAREGAR